MARTVLRDLAIMYRLLIVLLMIVRQRDNTHEASSLRVVRIQAEAAQRGIDSFCEVPNMHPDQTKGKEAQRKIRVEVD
jgi:hypothetical protein